MRKQSRLPPSVGVGFKPEHFADILAADQPVGFFEIHAENYMGAGGPPHAQLRALAERYALSVHGVALSIGAVQPLDREHLARVKLLCDRYQPASFSEHLAWSSHDEHYFNDLLPLPYNEENLARVIEHVDAVQHTLDREMLLENPARYVDFAESTMSECEFLATVSGRTGCGLLLDLNNVFVSSCNGGTSAERYLRDFPLERVKEIHLAGHDMQTDGTGAALCIDSHGAPVADPVWSLYEDVIARAGALPTLIEWDNNVPPWAQLIREARSAAAILDDSASGKAA
jgi:uncharacterized protein